MNLADFNILAARFGTSFSPSLGRASSVFGGKAIAADEREDLLEKLLQ